FARRESALWIDEARDAGVTATISMKEILGSLTGDLILNAARDAGASMIAVVSESTPLERLFGGSAVYGILRANRYVLLVYGPKAVVRHGRRREDKLAEDVLPPWAA
ncbi:MAG: hypothetical protein ACXVBE_07445, partial [Bdellovibrionota bacterium]